MGVGLNTLLSKSWSKVLLFIKLMSAPVSALSNTDGVDVDGEESALVLFLLKTVGSNATGNLIKCLFAWGTLTM